MTNEGLNDDVWKQIEETFNQIKKDADVEPEEDWNLFWECQWRRWIKTTLK